MNLIKLYELNNVSFWFKEGACFLPSDEDPNKIEKVLFNDPEIVNKVCGPIFKAYNEKNEQRDILNLLKENNDSFFNKYPNNVQIYLKLANHFYKTITNGNSVAKHLETRRKNLLNINAQKPTYCVITNNNETEWVKFSDPERVKKICEPIFNNDLYSINQQRYFLKVINSEQISNKTLYTIPQEVKVNIRGSNCLKNMLDPEILEYLMNQEKFLNCFLEKESNHPDRLAPINSSRCISKLPSFQFQFNNLG